MNPIFPRFPQTGSTPRAAAEEEKSEETSPLFVPRDAPRNSSISKAASSLSRTPGTLLTEELPPSERISVPVVQVPTPLERATALVTSLEHSNQLVKDFKRDFVKLQHAATMRFLMALDVTQIGDEAEWGSEMTNLITLNQELDFRRTPFILNNAGTPFQMLTFSAPEEGTGERTQSIVTPPLVLQNLKGAHGTQAPDRAPTTEENRTVRTHVFQALEAFYGKERMEAPESARLLLTPETQEQPLTYYKLQVILSDLGDPPLFKKELEDLSERYKPLSPDDGEHLHELFAGEEMNFQQLEAAFSKADASLKHPDQALGRALWHTGEMIARGGGVVVGTGAGVVLGAGVSVVLGPSVGPSLVGAVAGVAIAGVGAVGTVADVINALRSANLGAFLSDVLGVFLGAAFSGGISGFILFSKVITPRLWKYLSPEVAARKAGEAFSDLRGESAKKALTLMEEAQQVDMESKNNIDALFDQIRASLLPSEEGGSSASLSAFTASENDRENLEEAQQIILKALQSRIEYRADFMRRLAAKIQSEERRAQVGLQRMRPVVRGL